MVLALTAAINRVEREESYRVRWSLADALTALMRTTLSLSEAQYLRLFAGYGLDFANPDEVSVNFYPFPVLLTLNQVAKLTKRGPLGEEMLTFLRQLRDLTAGQSGDQLKVHLKTQEMLGQATGEHTLPTVVFAEGDALGRSLTEFVAALDRSAPPTAAWLGLLQRWQKATGSQP
ncbi:hypothetical protein, partial [Thermocatellispora tengchongensis]|uniref:hypothetical protein n=1 Tax=Thermocatellispora tengchongensis TaxID=1073253 RepID=UPI0031E6871C